MNNLTAAFKDLKGQGFFARQRFWCCQSCAGYAAATIVSDAIDKNPKRKETIKGCVYYHKQDASSKDDGKDFYLAFGPLRTEKHGDVGLHETEIGKIVVATLERHGVKTEWNGDGNIRILVKIKSIREEK